jgi:hypothetical protein
MLASRSGAQEAQKLRTWLGNATTSIGFSK